MGVIAAAYDQACNSDGNDSSALLPKRYPGRLRRRSFLARAGTQQGALRVACSPFRTIVLDHSPFVFRRLACVIRS